MSAICEEYTSLHAWFYQKKENHLPESPHIPPALSISDMPSLHTHTLLLLLLLTPLLTAWLEGSQDGQWTHGSWTSGYPGGHLIRGIKPSCFKVSGQTCTGGPPNAPICPAPGCPPWIRATQSIGIPALRRVHSGRCDATMSRADHRNNFVGTIMDTEAPCKFLTASNPSFSKWYD